MNTRIVVAKWLIILKPKLNVEPLDDPALLDAKSICPGPFPVYPGSATGITFSVWIVLGH